MGQALGTARALEVLEEHGLLLLTDARLPSLAALIAGAPVRGSWWGHPKGQAIYAACLALDDHPDVLAVKLVSGKVTFVHRRLWPALLSIATARDQWQRKGVGAAGRDLLARVEKEGRLRADRAGTARGTVGELEARLLVKSGSVHTEKGAHAKELESWKAWARRARLGGKPPSAAAGRRQLEAIVDGWNERFGGKARLPWA